MRKTIADPMAGDSNHLDANSTMSAVTYDLAHASHFSAQARSTDAAWTTAVVKFEIRLPNMQWEALTPTATQLNTSQTMTPGAVPVPHATELRVYIATAEGSALTLEIQVLVIDETGS